MLILLFSLFVLSLEYVSSQENCLTPSRQPGNCINVEQCTEIYSTIGTQKLTPERVEFFRQSQCGRSKNNKVLVCCPRSAQSNDENQVISWPPKQQLIKINVNDLSANLFPRPGDCGIGAESRSINESQSRANPWVASDRIYSGVETEIDEYPWLALLEYSKDGIGYGFHCGGSLINNRYVLTAAHCVQRANAPPNSLAISVRLGEWNTDTEVDCKKDINGIEDCSDPPINVLAETVIAHENYNKIPNSKYYDIALLRLADTVQYTDFISPICLPFTDNLRNSKFENTGLDVVGWGRTENKFKSNIKLKVTINTVDLQTCNSIYAKTQISLESGQICAGGKKGVDSCSGDSGGPLIGVDNSNRNQIHYFLAGIVSFGTVSCGLEGWPGVYTRVGHYIGWLQSNMKP